MVSRKTKSFYSIYFLIILFLFIFSMLVAQAYFTATAEDDYGSTFASMSIDFTDVNDELVVEESLTQTLGQVMPGETLDFSEFKIQNSGNVDIYSIVNLKLTITKTNGDIDNISEWYNLDGDRIYHTSLNANTAPATLISSHSSEPLSLTYTLEGYMFDQSYVGASIKVKILACAIQSRNLPNYNDITSQPVIATCMLIDEENEREVARNNVVYTLNSSGTAYLASALDTTITKAIIQSEYNGLPVTSVADNGFLDCTSLTSVVIPSSITSIGQAGFKNCTSLSSVDFQCEEITMWAEVFMNCTSLKHIDLPNFTDGYIRGNIFYASGLESIDIPYGTKTLGYSLFWYCTSLKSVNIPDTVETIERYVFRETGLESIFIPNSVKSLGSIQFYNCTNLKSVTFEEGCQFTEFGSYNFSNCTSLTTIYIPKSVTAINGPCFTNCNALESVYYYGTLEEWKNISISPNDSSNWATREANPMNYAEHLYIKINGTWIDVASQL